MWEQSASYTAMLIVAIACGCPVTGAARVCFLACCKPTSSNLIIMGNIARAVYDAGHEVSLVLPDNFAQGPNSLAFPGADIITYPSMSKYLDWQQRIVDSIFDASAYTLFREVGNFLTDYAEDVLGDKIFLKKLEKGNFDLIVLDNAPYQLSIVPYSLSLPFVYITPFYDPLTLGIPFMPSFVPHAISPYTDQMTRMQRFLNALLYVAFAVVDPLKTGNTVARLAPRLVHNDTDVLDMRPELWIVQTNHVLDPPRPSLPNVKLIGALTVRPTEPLPEHLRQFIESAENGVIFVAFGSANIRFPQRVFDIFVQVLSDLPYKIVWTTRSAVRKQNIVTVPWAPQVDVLAHKKTTLYISLCGSNSHYESIYHAVPILCFPISSDQFTHAANLERKGLGMSLPWNSIVPLELKQTIEQLINNSTFRENSKRFSELLRSSGRLPREEAAYWIDHVIKYGGAYMRSEGQKMTWYEFLLLDIFVICFFSVTISVVAISKCLKALRKFKNHKVKIQ